MLARHGLRRNVRGFTLIELMVVVIIVAVLLTIALPAFQNQVRRSNRAAAQAEMMAIANLQQQYLLSNRSYMDKTTLEATGYVLDPDVDRNYDYTITVNLATVPTYDIQFTATGSQAADGNLTLDEQGVGTPAGKWDR